MISNTKRSKGFNISVVIPVSNGDNFLAMVLESIENQSLLPKETIIVDSSSDNIIASIAKAWKGRMPIEYRKVNSAFPGHARNIGAKCASGEWIAFIDSKTIPVNRWLEKCVAVAVETGAGFVGGLTISEADTYFKELLRAASYGCKAYRTLPGSIVEKDCFEKSGGFIPDVCSSEDIEWMERLRKIGLRMEYLKEPVVRYCGLPPSLRVAARKYYRYAMATARTEIFAGQKKLYMSVLLILLTILVYEWNTVVAGWDEESILFIPHITKIYLACLVTIYIVSKGIRPWNRKIKPEVFERVYLLVIVVLITGLIYRWNYVFAGFNVHSVFYIPHIAKMYLGSLFLLSIIFRGVIRPLRRNVKWSFLFPFRWVQVGLIGVCLDIVKAPGYCLGAMLEIMGRSTSRKTIRVANKSSGVST